MIIFLLFSDNSFSRLTTISFPVATTVIAVGDHKNDTATEIRFPLQVKASSCRSEDGRIAGPGGQTQVQKSKFFRRKPHTRDIGVDT
jgi:hypothetical protein